MERSYTGYGITANTLKIIAIIAMLIDHIAWKFVPTATVLGISMHVIGRLTMPIMCYFIAEGFYHTRNVKKYALRLLLFAFISQIPFTYQQSGHFFPQYHNIFSVMESLNVLFNLFWGLIALWACKSNLRKAVKVLSVIGCCVLALATDWALFGVLYILAFGLNHNNLKKQSIWFSVVSVFMIGGAVTMGPIQLFQAGVFLSLFCFFLYNGERGGYAWSKWVFYAFYPIHMLILGYIKFGL